MKSPNNGRDRAPTEHLLSPNEASRTTNGLHLIELLAKEIPQTPKNNSGYCQGYSCFPQTYVKPYYQRQTPTQLIEHTVVEVMPTSSLHPNGLVLLVLKIPLHTTKGER